MENILAKKVRDETISNRKRKTYRLSMSFFLLEAWDGCLGKDINGDPSYSSAIAMTNE